MWIALYFHNKNNTHFFQKKNWDNYDVYETEIIH